MNNRPPPPTPTFLVRPERKKLKKRKLFLYVRPIGSPIILKSIFSFCWEGVGRRMDERINLQETNQQVICVKEFLLENYLPCLLYTLTALSLSIVSY